MALKLTLKRAIAVLESFFGKETNQVKAAISLLEQGFFSYTSLRFSYSERNPLLISEKLGGFPWLNYEKYGLKLVGDPNDDFPVFEIDGKIMQFIAQIKLRTSNFIDDKVKKGMLFFFVQYQDADNYEESCPICKIIHEPDMPKYFVNTDEYAQTIGITSENLHLYNKGVNLNFVETYSFPNGELLLQKFPDLFNREILKNYDKKVISKGSVHYMSPFMYGNPVFVQGPPIGLDEILLLQVNDPRPISSENYNFYFAIKKEDVKVGNFDYVTTWGELS